VLEIVTRSFHELNEIWNS